MRAVLIGAAVGFFTCGIGSTASLAAEDARRPSAQTTASPSMTTSPAATASSVTSKEIETAIQDLHNPISNAQLDRVVPALDKVASAAERDRLQQLFSERMQKLMKEANTPEGIAERTKHLNSDDPDEKFLSRIRALNLGSDATAADLQARDEVVAAISGVTDPVRRDKFLSALEQRERQADTAVYAPPKDSKKP